MQLGYMQTSILPMGFKFYPTVSMTTTKQEYSMPPFLNV
jgi:hypothetical protein